MKKKFCFQKHEKKEKSPVDPFKLSRVVNRNIFLFEDGLITGPFIIFIHIVMDVSILSYY